MKEIDQDGLLRRQKNTFRPSPSIPFVKKWWWKKRERKEKREVSLPPETFDPLSIFARCYLKENLIFIRTSGCRFMTA